MFLLDKRTSLQEITIQSEIKPNNLPNPELQVITDSFVHQCERELADLIGPIAKFLVQKTVRSSGQSSRAEFVNVLASQIPEPQKALQFQHRLLS